MNRPKWNFLSLSLILGLGIAGCGIATHVDCDQVAQQQRAGTSDTDIAQQSGHTVADVQACSQTGSSGGRETANNYQDAPHLPSIPNISISGGSIHP